GLGDVNTRQELTQEVLAAAGMPAYEISNHARPGEACRHNLVYWRCGDYTGIGPGAHGRLTLGGTRWALRQHRAPEAWLAAVEGAGHATRERRALPPTERLAETLMMGLRLAEGVPLARLRAAAGAAQNEMPLDPAALRRLVSGGFVSLDGERLTATPAGRQRLDAVLAALLA
ncbi:MAG: coproporphyrinogen III oxidase, partial [Rhodospirillaceae bacterium]|nr:coproporphyrinogen III oxidase [Rhodospirillaceae bacterium]